MVEENRVQIEVRSPMEGDLQVPVNIAPLGHLPRDIFLRDNVHDQQVQSQDAECHRYVVDVPEEVYVGVIPIEVGFRGIVKFSGKLALPIAGIHSYILILNLSETGKSLAQQCRSC